jgi:signal peptidase I
VFVGWVYPVEGLSMWRTLEGSNRKDGTGSRDLVLVDKLSLLWSRPERLRICVFRHKSELSVKRLVGLPGETIDFRGGDVFIRKDGGDFERMTRPPGLIEAQMIPVPAGEPAAPLLEGNGPSQPDGDGTIWKPRPEQTLTVRLRYGAGSDSRCITDDYLVWDDRGRRVAPGRHAVPDVRVTVASLQPGSGSIAFIHELGLGERRKILASASGIEISSRVGGVESVRARFPSVKCENGLRFETIDGLFRVSLRDGTGWRELFSEPRDTATPEGFSGVSFEVEGGPVRVGPLEVTRDVHYVWGSESLTGGAPLSIPPDRMFLVGDNPEFSTDSRRLEVGPVPVAALVGIVRAIVLPWNRKGFPL